MDGSIEPMRALAPLYKAGETFAVTRDGLEKWRASDCFRRVLAFYAHYPSRSVFNSAGRALLHHLVMMQRPARILEIGTMHAGTTEVLARAAWEADTGHVETIDPYGAERCPPLIAEFPAELRQRITFAAATSAWHLNEAIERGWRYDLVLVDGNHELEFAAFDLDAAARVMTPGGIIVMDNAEQIGPRFATRHFLDRHPEWIDVADVVRLMDENDPLAEPVPSFPDTKNYVLQAPPGYVVGKTPRSFGTQRTDSGELDGIELDIAGPANGMLHAQVFVRTFGKILHSEELSTIQRVALAISAPSKLRVALDRPLRSAVSDDTPELSRRMEIIVAFVGAKSLSLRVPPLPYPARYV